MRHRPARFAVHTAAALVAALAVTSPGVRAADPASPPAALEAGVADEGELLTAFATLLGGTPEIARLAVIVVDSDENRRLAVERALVRVLRERQREDIVTPALIEARLGAAARGQLEEAGGAMRSLAADHVVVAEVLAGADGASLALRLLKSETGAVVQTASVPLTIAATSSGAPASSARVQGVRQATVELADQIAEAIEKSGNDPRLYVLAVAPVKAEGAAQTGKVDLLLQNELGASLRERGFLLVERARLKSAMDQLALAQMTDDASVGAVGKAVAAQSLVLSTVAEAADTFILSLRVVDVESGKVLGVAQATLKRDNVVALSAAEVRTPGEAVFRSVVAPGWGQAYNGSPTKSVLFGVVTYGGLATTAALGIGAGVSYSSYLGVNADGRSPSEAVAEAQALREQTNVLILGTAIAGGITGVSWLLNVGDAFIDATVD